MDHYEIISLIGMSRVLMHTVDAVVGTGAGPNLIRESLLRYGNGDDMLRRTMEYPLFWMLITVR